MTTILFSVKYTMSSRFLEFMRNVNDNCISEATDKNRYSWFSFFENNSCVLNSIWPSAADDY